MGGSVDKIKSQDLQTNPLKLCKAIQEWINKQDSRRLALYLSAVMTYGTTRIINAHIGKIQRDLAATMVEIAQTAKVAMTLNEPIDIAVMTANLDLTEPQPNDADEASLNLDESRQVNIDLITIREDPIVPRNLAEEYPDDEDGFGGKIG